MGHAKRECKLKRTRKKLAIRGWVRPYVHLTCDTRILLRNRKINVLVADRCLKSPDRRLLKNIGVLQSAKRVLHPRICGLDPFFA